MTLRAGVAGAVAVLVSAAVLAGASRGGPGQSAQPPSSPVALEIHSAHGASFVPALQGKRPLFVLALGSDARPGQSIERERSDSIHLIGVDLAHRRATILGFPRDSWVPIPGVGTTKINTAMSSGGPPLMVRTIEALTGVRIDFWMLTSFKGFSRMVDGIGGLTVRVRRPMHDVYSGANFEPGRHHFKGGHALAFARDRHDVPGGDLGRSANQGILLLSALSKLRSVFAKDPSRLFTWISVAWHNIHTDLGVETLLDLALTATRISPQHVNNLVVPSTTGFVGSASVVFISPSAAALYADMRTDGVIGRP